MSWYTGWTRRLRHRIGVADERDSTAVHEARTEGVGGGHKPPPPHGGAVPRAAESPHDLEVRSDAVGGGAGARAPALRPADRKEGGADVARVRAEISRC